MDGTIELDGTRLTLEEFRSVVDEERPCSLSPSARPRVEAARQMIERVTTVGDDSPPVYGVNTGFGDLSKVRVPSEQTRLLQERLVRSHAAGVGEALPDRVVRGMLLLRANTLALGHSGVRPDLIDLLVERYGDRFGYYVYDKQKRVRDYLSFMMNGVNVNSLSGFDTPLSDGDVVSLLPPIGGG